MSDLKGRFPDLLPMETIRQGPETHTYEVIEYSDGSTSARQTYVPDKAPVIEVEQVSGIVDGETYDFDEGIDYAVTDSDNDGRLETIDFSIGGESPDENTEFQITYICRSVIVRYVESYEDEFHRVQDDIETVIDSRYVDEATNTGFIDDFEDEQIIEYDIQSGTEFNATVQSSVVLGGDWALELNSPSAGTEVRIASTSGLPRYPKRGDTFTYYTRLENADDISYFDFLYSVSESGNDRYYQTVVDGANGEFSVQKQDGSVKSDVASVSLGSEIGDWIRVETTVEPIGSIVSTLYDSDGVEIGSVSIADTEYDTCGIRFAASNPSGVSEVYFDSADIIQRNSSDLDRIGAIFGALGKRRGRTDDNYATFLRSIVQSFSGRGTVDGIKFAVASALNLDADQIFVQEDFQDNTYTVEIRIPFPPHELSTLTALADLADPSGVNFGGIVYDVVEDEVQVADTIEVTLGTAIGENVAVDDTSVVTEASVAWDTGNWDQMNWAVENN